MIYLEQRNMLDFHSKDIINLSRQIMLCVPFDKVSIPVAVCFCQ